jgi:hypothetical protein
MTLPRASWRLKPWCRHADCNVPDPGPGIEPGAQRPEGSVVRGHRAPGEAERGDEKSTALV